MSPVNHDLSYRYFAAVDLTIRSSHCRIKLWVIQYYLV